MNDTELKLRLYRLNSISSIQLDIRNIKGLSFMELLIVGGRFDGFAQTFTKSAGFKRGPQSSHLFLP